MSATSLILTAALSGAASAGLTVAIVSTRRNTSTEPVAVEGDHAAPTFGAAHETPAAAGSDALAAVFSASLAGMALVATDGTLLRVNHAFGLLAGRPSEELVGLPAPALFHDNEKESTAAAIALVGGDGRKRRSRDGRIATAAGGLCVVDLSLCVLETVAEGRCVLLQAVDVTDRHRAGLPSESPQLIDPLTGVANPRGFDFAVEVALATTTRETDAPQLLLVAVQAADDSDEALRSTASVLKSMVRAGDVIGRLDGDEFAVLLPCAPAGIAGELADRLRSGAAASGLVSPATLRTGTAVVGPDEAPDLATLLDRARVDLHAIESVDSSGAVTAS